MDLVHGVSFQRRVQCARPAKRLLLRTRPDQKSPARLDPVGEIERQGPLTGQMQQTSSDQSGLIGDLNSGNPRWLFWGKCRQLGGRRYASDGLLAGIHCITPIDASSIREQVGSFLNSAYRATAQLRSKRAVKAQRRTVFVSEFIRVNALQTVDVFHRVLSSGLGKHPSS